MDNNTMTASEKLTVAEAEYLQQKVLEKDFSLGVWFYSELLQSWEHSGIEEGTRSACWSLQQELAHTVGGWSLFTHARALACD